MCVPRFDQHPQREGMSGCDQNPKRGDWWSSSCTTIVVCIIYFKNVLISSNTLNNAYNIIMHFKYIEISLTWASIFISQLLISANNQNVFWNIYHCFHCRHHPLGILIYYFFTLWILVYHLAKCMIFLVLQCPGYVQAGFQVT